MIQLGAMDGDSRTWASGRVPCSESRGCLTVDFDRKLLTLQLNPTCGWFWPTATPYGCSDPFKFNCGAVWYTEEYNCLSAREDPSTGRISLRWDLTQSRMPIIRPARTIGGKMTITPTSFGGSVVYTGDLFPKQELYYFIGAKRYKVFQTGQSNEPDGMAHAGATINGSFRTYFV